MNEAVNITDLSGKTAVVIGGTSGLGRAIAIALARSGANVVPAARRGNFNQDADEALRQT